MTDSPTCYKYSLRLIFAVCASKLWKIHSLDITTAFLQGRSIDRDIYVKPPKEAGVPDDKLWKLNVCVYGLGDASRQWYLTIVEKLKDLNVHPCKHDPAVFRYFSQGNLKGIISTHVDDFFYCGDADFHENIITALKSMFSIKTEHDSSFKYLGLNVVQNETDFSITVDQEQYISSLEKININGENPPDMPLNDDQLKKFRCLIGQLMWVANQTRPDILFDLCQLSSSCKNATQKDISIINKIVSKVTQQTLKLHYRKLDLNSLKLICYNDAAFGNLISGGSQGGYIIFLSDSQNNALPIMWQSRKLKRIVKSAMAAETLIQVDAAEACYSLQCLLKELLFQDSEKVENIPIICKTDSRQLYQAVH